ncbi:MAG: J domain-containing protein, partial [Desulfobacterales bacterium]|nr:J domain-containing protein [Desulfobacterales bacterium]
IETAEAFINGTWDILKNYPEIQNSFEILGVTDQWNLELIKKRFRVLAKTYHPDVVDVKDTKSAESFIKIQKAYDIVVKYMTPFYFNHQS